MKKIKNIEKGIMNAAKRVCEGIRNFKNEERGASDFVTVIILIVIVIAIAAIFKNQLASIVNILYIKLVAWMNNA